MERLLPWGGESSQWKWRDTVLKRSKGGQGPWQEEREEELEGEMQELGVVGLQR